jgi:hypothetical protein
MIMLKDYNSLVFVPAAMFLTIVIHTFSPPAISKDGRLSFPEILMLVLLPILIDYFNGCARACNFSIAAQIKIMGEPSSVLQVYGSLSIFGCLQKSIRLCSGRRKGLKTSNIC